MRDKGVAIITSNGRETTRVAEDSSLMSDKRTFRDR